MSGFRRGVWHFLWLRSTEKEGVSASVGNWRSSQLMLTSAPNAGTLASGRGGCFVVVLSSSRPVRLKIESRSCGCSPTPRTTVNSQDSSTFQKYSVTVVTTLLVTAAASAPPIESSLTVLVGLSTSRVSSRSKVQRSSARKRNDTALVLAQSHSSFTCAADTPKLERQLSCEAAAALVKHSAKRYLSSYWWWTSPAKHGALAVLSTMRTRSRARCNLDSNCATANSCAMACAVLPARATRERTR
mmetsp:Transcript_65099/g.180564  ORF Transcript_65099/g.180564 Transcript_65099/m.180564 type:complete len:244 (+) Transcript_65099:1792-2523(+)